MNGRFVSLSILTMMMTPHACFGEDVELAARKIIVVGDGPFEIKNESGVIGFVVAMEGKTVTFRPCVGETFSLERERLVRTNNKCKDAPSTDQNPLVASCNDAWIDLDKTKVAEAIKGTEPVGTTFVSASDNSVHPKTMNTDEMMTAVRNVAHLRDCGRFTIGYDTEGKVNLNIIKPMQTIQLDNLQ